MTESKTENNEAVTTTNLNGTINQEYDYDAFGNEKNPDALDTNPFRYCGEYLDFETGDYYLRARYYDPSIGRFTQQDTHWNTANMIYGDNPQKINEREDKLGLKTYFNAPQITAVIQSGNLYIYALNNPANYLDHSGQAVTEAVLILIAANPEIAAAIATGVLGGLVFLGHKTVELINQVLNSSSRKKIEQAAKEAAAKNNAVAAPASPDPDDDKSSSNFKKYSANEIERKYGMKSGQYHREVKRDILSDLAKNPSYKSLLNKMGKNPDIYLSPDGRIQIVSTVYKGKSFITDLYIQYYLP